MLMLGATATASAQAFEDFFTTTYNGKEITNGETIVAKAEVDDLGASYHAPIHIINKEDTRRSIVAIMQYAEPGSAQVNEKPEFWGVAGMCYEGGEQMGENAGNACISAGGNFATVCASDQGAIWIPAAGKDTFVIDPDLSSADKKAVSTYKVLFVAFEGEELDAIEEISSAVFTVNVLYTTDLSAVEGIEADEAAPVYYDLTGNRVANPEKGIYIRVAGDKTTKVAL